MNSWFKKKNYAINLGYSKLNLNVFRVPKDEELKLLFLNHMQKTDPFIKNLPATLTMLSELPPQEALEWLKEYLIKRKEKCVELTQNIKNVGDYKILTILTDKNSPLFELYEQYLKIDRTWLEWLLSSSIASHDKNAFFDFLRLEAQDCYMHSYPTNENILSLFPFFKNAKDIRSCLRFLIKRPYEFKQFFFNEDLSQVKFLKDPLNLKEFLKVFGNEKGEIIFDEKLFHFFQKPEDLEVFKILDGPYFFKSSVVDLFQYTLNWKDVSEIRVMLEKAKSLNLEMTSMNKPEFWIHKSLSSVLSREEIEKKMVHERFKIRLGANHMEMNLITENEQIKADIYQEWERKKTYWKEVLNWCGNINAQDERGWSALHRAAFEEIAIAVEILLELGANPLLKTKEGLTPMQLLQFAISTEKEYPGKISRLESREQEILQSLELAQLQWIIPKGKEHSAIKPRL